MKRKPIFIILCFLLLALLAIYAVSKKEYIDDTRFISYEVDPKKQDIKLYWKDEKAQVFRSIQNLKLWLGKKRRKLVFAMNAGMYKTDKSPLGLYIEDKLTLSPLNRLKGDGNFYLKPNGVFYISSDNIPVIRNTLNFKNDGKINYATQSGPMLVIEGKIHPSFAKSSSNLNIRNGVGILPGNKIVFAMSKTGINLYDFASYFKSIGCKNALYLDGFVSRTYLPEKNWNQVDGNFGVIVGVTVAAD